MFSLLFGNDLNAFILLVDALVWVFFCHGHSMAGQTVVIDRKNVWFECSCFPVFFFYHSNAISESQMQCRLNKYANHLYQSYLTLFNITRRSRLIVRYSTFDNNAHHLIVHWYLSTRSKTSALLHSEFADYKPKLKKVHSFKISKKKVSLFSLDFSLISDGKIPIWH